MKKNRGNEPTGAIKYIYMEVPQENSLCKQPKMSFLVSFTGEQECGTGPALVKVVSVGGGEGRERV
jgi:hypothetical protein